MPNARNRRLTDEEKKIFYELRTSLSARFKCEYHPQKHHGSRVLGIWPTESDKQDLELLQYLQDQFNPPIELYCHMNLQGGIYSILEKDIQEIVGSRSSPSRFLLTIKRNRTGLLLPSDAVKKAQNDHLMNRTMARGGSAKPAGPWTWRFQEKKLAGLESFSYPHFDSLGEMIQPYIDKL